MAYVYHYYGFWQSKPGEIVHVDGTITRESMITSRDEYDGVKKAIAEHHEVTKFTLSSLILLNPPLPPCGQPYRG